MSELDPRLSKAVTAHSLIVASLSVVHSLRTRGLRRTLVFAVSGSAIPILSELVAVNVLEEDRRGLIDGSERVIGEAAPAHCGGAT